MARKNETPKMSMDQLEEYKKAIRSALNPPIEPAGPGMGALRQAESEITPPAISQEFTGMGDFRKLEETTPLPIAGLDYEVPGLPIDTSTIGMEEVTMPRRENSSREQCPMLVFRSIAALLVFLVELAALSGCSDLKIPAKPLRTAWTQRARACRKLMQSAD